MLKQAYKQADMNYEIVMKQNSALEDEAVKGITGENQIDLSFINEMLVNPGARLGVNTRALEQAMEIWNQKDNFRMSPVPTSRSCFPGVPVMMMRTQKQSI